VVFDIGGVLEIAPDLGVTRQWEARLGLPAGGLGERMRDAWAGGSIGTLTEDEVQQSIRDRRGLDVELLAACTRSATGDNAQAIGDIQKLLADAWARGPTGAGSRHRELLWRQATRPR
jgi:hypothetical protein